MPVINIKVFGTPLGSIRIDRKTKWGNRFIIGKDGTRDEVIDLYEKWLTEQIISGRISLQELADLHEKYLCCWCAPKPCHGNVLLKFAEIAHEILVEDGILQHNTLDFFSEP